MHHARGAAAELWQETGRFTNGPELLRIKRIATSATLSSSPPARKWSPTSRARSSKLQAAAQNLYQIQTKFRDERRPRFGLMRGREFIMKDAYSFDRI